MDINTIKGSARLLNLQNLANGRIDLLHASTENLMFLQDIIEQELLMRHEKKTARILKESGLPNKPFVFESLPKVIKWQIEKLLEFELVQQSDNLLLIGNCNSGKTSLVSYLGKRAIGQGHKVIYLVIETILNKDKKLDDKLKDADLVIIDDALYVPFTNEQLQRLYRTIVFLNESRSIAIVTNRELSEWISSAEDKHLMQTLLDRLMASSQTLRLGK